MNAPVLHQRAIRLLDTIVGLGPHAAVVEEWEVIGKLIDWLAFAGYEIRLRPGVHPDNRRGPRRLFHFRIVEGLSKLTPAPTYGPEPSERWPYCTEGMVELTLNVLIMEALEPGGLRPEYDRRGR